MTPANVSRASHEAPASEAPPARWVHRVAVLTVCLVWPLIWVGGLVTTYDAGMAVPDWPGTYGYNLFLYPYEIWLLGPFDLFIEHGHRLLGATVGLVAIALVLIAFWKEPRRWVRWWSVGVLLAVIAQGSLGGARVLLDDRTLAMTHGCVGPAFFCLCVVLAVATSRWWWRVAASAAEKRPAISPTIIGLVVALVAVSLGQLILGARLRHVHPDASPESFTHTVLTHVAGAFALWGLTLLTWGRLRRCGDLTLSRPTGWLVGFMSLQIALGIGTWVVHYGFPVFLNWVPGAAGFLVRSKGFADSLVVTSHVATGSLILAVSTMILVRCLRLRHLLRDPVTASASNPSSGGVVDSPDRAVVSTG